MELKKAEAIKYLNRLIERGIKADLILIDPPYGTIKGLNFRTGTPETTAGDVPVPTKEIFPLYERLLRQGGRLIMFSQEPFTGAIIQAHRQCGSLQYAHKYYGLKPHAANALSAATAPVGLVEEVLVFTNFYDASYSHPLRAYARRMWNGISGQGGLNSRNDINRLLGHRKAEHFLRFDTLQFTLPSRAVYDELVKRGLTTGRGLDKVMPDLMTYEQLKAVNRRYQAIFNLHGQKSKPNVLNYKRDRLKLHPTQKPVALLKDLILTYSNPGDTVVDCFAGSGSTAIACKALDRRFYGCELNADYAALAQRRIKGALSLVTFDFEMKKEGEKKDDKSNIQRSI